MRKIHSEAKLREALAEDPSAAAENSCILLNIRLWRNARSFGTICKVIFSYVIILFIF